MSFGIWIFLPTYPLPNYLPRCHDHGVEQTESERKGTNVSICTLCPFSIPVRR